MNNGKARFGLAVVALAVAVSGCVRDKPHLPGIDRSAVKEVGNRDLFGDRETRQEQEARRKQDAEEREQRVLRQRREEEELRIKAETEIQNREAAAVEAAERAEFMTKSFYERWISRGICMNEFGAEVALIVCVNGGVRMQILHPGERTPPFRDCEGTISASGEIVKLRGVSGQRVKFEELSEKEKTDIRRDWGPCIAEATAYFAEERRRKEEELVAEERRKTESLRRSRAVNERESGSRSEHLGPHDKPDKADKPQKVEPKTVDKPDKADKPQKVEPKTVDKPDKHHKPSPVKPEKPEKIESVDIQVLR